MTIDAQLARIRANIEAKTKNSNKDAAADPMHDISDNSVTKSHALSRAYYRLSLTEKRCMEALISKLHPLRSDNELHHIELLATEYLKAFPDAGKHAYEHLANAGDALVNRVITIENPKEGIERDKLTLMARIRYVPNQGKVICTFNPLVVPHLIGLREKFSSYPLKKAVDFSSSYTWRFYEILASWAQPKNKTGGKFLGWIDLQSVDELREMLGVPDSYKWVHFSKMLNDSILELKIKARIIVSVQQIKTSRKITHLNISFIEDDQIEMKLEGGEKPKKKSRRKPKQTKP